MNRRAAQSACPVRQRKSSSSHIDLHPGDGIDHRQRIRAARLRRLRDLPDIGHVRAQLHDHRLPGRLFHRRCDLLDRPGIRSERDPALLHVRAGNVDFQKIRAFFVREPPHTIDVLLRAVSADIHDHLRVKLLQEPQIPLRKCLLSGILKTDGIQHPGGCLADSRGRVTRPRNRGHALRHNRAKPVQIDKFRKFLSGPEGSGRRHDRVLQQNPGNLHTHIRLHIPVHPLQWRPFQQGALFFLCCLPSHPDLSGRYPGFQDDPDSPDSRVIPCSSSQFYISRIENRSFRADSLVPYFGMFIDISRFADAAETGTDPAGHLLLE